MRRFVTLSVLVAMLLIAACSGSMSAPAAPAAEAPAAAAPATEAPAAEAAPADATVAETTTAEAAPAEAAASDASAASAADLAEVDPAQVTGDIVTAGSSTVYPLSEAIAEMFIDEGYAGNLTIDSIGSGAGFERFCVAGETDISNASRAIKDSEKESCAKIGRDPVDFRIGTDAIAVVVNPENTWLADGVTLDQLALIFSNQATNWSDVDPSWPAEPIQRFTPGTDSGTFDYFIEAVMDKKFVTSDADKGKGEEAFLKASNLQLSEDDNVLVQGVEGSKNAIGFFGYAYYNENKGKLNALPLNGVAPESATVLDGTYPLARPLFLYTSPNILADKPQVASFLAYYLENVSDVISGVGYFPEKQEDLDAAKAKLASLLGQ